MDDGWTSSRNVSAAYLVVDDNDRAIAVNKVNITEYIWGIKDMGMESHESF